MALTWITTALFQTLRRRYSTVFVTRGNVGTLVRKYLFVQPCYWWGEYSEYPRETLFASRLGVKLESLRLNWNFWKRRKKVELAVAFTLSRSEIVWKRHFCRKQFDGTVSKRSEMKTERLAASCEHKRRYFFVPNPKVPTLPIWSGGSRFRGKSPDLPIYI